MTLHRIFGPFMPIQVYVTCRFIIEGNIFCFLLLTPEKNSCRLCAVFNAHWTETLTWWYVVGIIKIITLSRRFINMNELIFLSTDVLINSIICYNSLQLLEVFGLEKVMCPNLWFVIHIELNLSSCCIVFHKMIVLSMSTKKFTYCWQIDKYLGILCFSNIIHILINNHQID